MEEKDCNMNKQVYEGLTEEDRAIVEFGIAQGKVQALGILVGLLIGLLFQVFWQSILFIMAFMPLRMYAGGYHADTQKRCSIMSAFIMCGACAWMRFSAYTGVVAFISMIILLIIVIILAPVENDNKMLDELEKKVYGKRTRIIAFVEFGIFSIAFVMQWNFISMPIVASFVMVCTLVVLGKIKYRNLYKMNRDS